MIRSHGLGFFCAKATVRKLQTIARRAAVLSWRMNVFLHPLIFQISQLNHGGLWSWFHLTAKETVSTAGEPFSLFCWWWFFGF